MTLCPRKLAFWCKRAGIQEKLLLLVSLFKRRGLLPKLSSTHLVFFERTSDICQLFLETFLNSRVFLFLGYLLSSTSLTLVKSLIISLRNAFILLQESVSAILKALPFLYGCGQLRFDR